MPRGVRLTGYRSRIVLRHLGRVVDVHKSTVWATTLREGLMTGLRSLPTCVRRTAADTATIYVDWHGRIRAHPGRDHPVYQVTLVLPPPPL